MLLEVLKNQSSGDPESCLIYIKNIGGWRDDSVFKSLMPLEKKETRKSEFSSQLP